MEPMVDGNETATRLHLLEAAVLALRGTVEGLSSRLEPQMKYIAGSLSRIEQELHEGGDS